MKKDGEMNLEDYLKSKDLPFKTQEEKVSSLAEHLIQPKLPRLLNHVGQNFFRIKDKRLLHEWIHGVQDQRTKQVEEMGWQTGQAKALAYLHAIWLTSDPPQVFDPTDVARLCGDKASSSFWNPLNHNLARRTFSDANQLEEFVTFSLSGSRKAYLKANNLFRSWLLIHVEYESRFLCYRPFPHCCDKCECTAEVDEFGNCPCQRDDCRSVIAYKEDKDNAPYQIQSHQPQLRFFAQDTRRKEDRRFCRACGKRVPFLIGKNQKNVCSFCNKPTHGGAVAFWFPLRHDLQSEPGRMVARSSRSDSEIEDLFLAIAKAMDTPSFEIRKLESIITKLRNTGSLDAADRQTLRSFKTMADIVEYVWEKLQNETYNHSAEIPGEELLEWIQDAQEFQKLKVDHRR